ncbi:MAG: ribosome small subunit-dependent GTPase A [Flavobacteriaceae bacterium]|jgi:ribosome biogenesis GTPase|nr:ribosome small subunit-dependent GTPase A [Flavobacteriaceae bacterium]
MKGIVYKSTGSWYVVKTASGDVYECRIKGKFRIKGIKSTNPIAVGDQVEFDVEKKGDETVGIIHSIEERKNYIIRKSVNLSKQTQIIASNIDLALLLVTIDNPPTLTAFIDRFLVTAEAYDIPVVLVFNKADSYTDQSREEAQFLQMLYKSIGYQCVEISAIKKRGLDQIIDLMKDQTTLVSGHSGTGKSTLINAISPGLKLKTTEISELYSQGQHTTTFAEMYDLSFGGQIIDTPGIKGFGVVDMEPETIGDYFPEFFKLKSACKFNNCLHIDEPHCAVKEALDENRIAWSRYRSYIQMMEGEDEHYRVNNYSE